jgi:Spy/CpxP family protein refolding chaperone
MIRFPTPSRKTLLLTLSVLLLPTLAFAAGLRGAGIGGFHGHGGMMDRIADKLDLTADQKSQITDLMKSHRDEIKANMDKIRAARQAELAAIHADTFDESAIRAAAAKVAEAEADMAVSRGKIAAEVRQVLTSEQREKAKELLKDAQAAGNGLHYRFHDHLSNGPSSDSQ